MQDQSLRDASPERFDGPSERFAGPYIRPFHTSLSFPLMALAVGVAVAAVYAYFVLYQSLAPLTHVEAPAPLATAQPPAPKPAPAVSTVPDVLPAASLPSLDNSDAMMREKLVDLMGRVPFAELILPAALVRRIVATVDNLPRETAPRRVIPLAPVP